MEPDIEEIITYIPKTIFIDNFEEVYHRLKRDYQKVNFPEGVINIPESFQYTKEITLTPNHHNNSITIKNKNNHTLEEIEDLKSKLYLKLKKFNFTE